MSVVTPRGTHAPAGIGQAATLEAFLDELFAKGLGEAAIGVHRTAVERFAEFLAPRAPWECAERDVEAFLGYLAQLGVSEKSLGAYRKVCASWVEFAARNVPTQPVEIDRARGGTEPEPLATASFTTSASPAVSAFEAVEAPRPSALDALRDDTVPPLANEFSTMMIPAAPVARTPEPVTAFSPLEQPAAATPVAEWGTSLPAAPLPEPPVPAAGWDAASAEAWGTPAPQDADGDVALFDDDRPAPVKIIKTAPLPPPREATPPPGSVPPPGSGVRGIPLAAPVDDDRDNIVALGDAVVPTMQRRQAPAVDEKPKGWSVQSSTETVHDLDLAEIRDRVRRGDLRAEDRVRRPGGDWVKVAEYAPLRSILDEARGAQRRPRSVPRTTSFPRGGAVLGGICAAFLCGTVAWVFALVAGWSAPPMAILGGIMGASFARRAAGGGLGPWTGAAGALSALGAWAWERYLVAQTVDSGVVSASAMTDVPSMLSGPERQAVAFGCVFLGAILGWLLGRRAN